MKTNILAATAAFLITAAPLAALAKPYTPHHTSAGMRHSQNGYHAPRHRSTKAERQQRRQNTKRYGDPNARNPSQEGYQQQLGSTTNGTRY